ncbi:sigma-70 family RNA polymerase sigma factor [Paractinoplanes atraurantiacus]|uniref:RNA polymerase sigma-70 factor, ECF subfamily n=1 Tax=Paractinoplanes atraurantiacus TaxID=1036182 RepID=A0A285KD60_9ACTN|nr:sigma-70 family RNA polymerase sigma factor [Actinoplanes atraurantiacus]SNY69877.1 RNA polymerase sigma-70 factor, ECF subfamily [Actinoplanes atraurantiacus]
MARPKEAPGDAPGHLRELITEQRPVLTRYALSLTSGNHAMAEDLVQEAIVRAWRSLKSVPRDETGSRRWLFTVVRRLFVDDFRRRQVRPAEVGEVDLAATVVEEDSTLMVVASHTLRDAVDRLSEVQREVLFEVFFENRPVDEVARRLGVPEGTVRSRMHYALRFLREAVTG